MGDNVNENNNGNRGFEGTNPPIVSTTINADNFEFKPMMFQMINNNGLFGGMPSDEPLSHLRSFNQMCNNFKQRGMTTDAFRLRLFPYTLQGKARDRFDSLPSDSITTWEELREKFLQRFFRPTQNANLRNAITSFRQMDGESLWEVWERWNNLLRKCLAHRLPDDVKLETFYQVPTDRVHASGSKGSTSAEVRLVAQNDELAAVLASIKSMMKNMMSSSGMKEKKVDFCAVCQGVHDYSDYPQNLEFVFFIYRQNFPRQNNLYSETYNPGWRNHPTFSWCGQQQQHIQPQQEQFQQRPQNPPGFYQMPNQQVRPQGGAFHQASGSSSKLASPSSNQEMSPFKKEMMEFMIKQDQKTEAREKNQAIAMRNLENQIGQLV
ncbi:uncharacterized protein LOC111914946 [Lactuca sativa]|uniref:uncharacterized protein LOC111914946 n=1 Tax=Lactuca sativa TaxID=4236 RepID=UPI000CD98527|nr:uncharacterized protein LOC111914946 [Lactuca sativa]